MNPNTEYLSEKNLYREAEEDADQPAPSPEQLAAMRLDIREAAQELMEKMIMMPFTTPEEDALIVAFIDAGNTFLKAFK